MTAPPKTASAPVPHPTPHTRALLLTIVAVAFGIRLLHFVTISNAPFLKFPLVSDQSDMYSFWQWAHAILSGDWLGRDTYHPDPEWKKQVAPAEQWYRWWGGKAIYHQAPLYPYFLAGLLALKDSLDWVIGLQLLLGALHPLIMFGLARQLFDDRVALVAAALIASYGPFVFYEGVLLRDWLPPVLEPLVLLLIVMAKRRGGGIRWMLAGGAMALAALTKETTLAVSAFAILWLVHQLWRERRPVLRPLALLTAGFVVCLSPLVARNLTVGASPLAISVQGPGNLLVGLSAENIPVGYYSIQSMAVVRDTTGDSFVRSLVVALRTHKGSVLGLLRHQFYKIRGLIDAFEVPNNVSYSYGRQISPVLTWTIGYGFVFPLGAAGFLFLRRRWPDATLLYWYLAAALLIQFVTFILSRFRLAFVPVLILAGAALLVHLFEAVRMKRWRLLSAQMSAVLLFIVLQQFWAPFSQPADTVEQVDHVSAAQVYLADHRYDRALQEVTQFRQTGATAAITLLPEVSHKARMVEGDGHIQWAFDLLQQNQVEEARTHIRLAEKAYTAEPAAGEASYNLGLGYLRLKDRNRARAYLEQFLALEPAGARARHAKQLLGLLNSEADSERLEP